MRAQPATRHYAIAADQRHQRALGGHIDLIQLRQRLPHAVSQHVGLAYRGQLEREGAQIALVAAYLDAGPEIAECIEQRSQPPRGDARCVHSLDCRIARHASSRALQACLLLGEHLDQVRLAVLAGLTGT